MKSRNLIMTVVGLGLALSGVMPGVASAETSGDVSAQAVHRKSLTCTAPSTKKINISYGDGSVSTTVYYNNHCYEAHAILLEFKKESGFYDYECVIAPRLTEGNKKVNQGSPNKVWILEDNHC